MTDQKPKKPFSLRLRLILVGSLIMAISLSLVGVGLDAAFSTSAETALRERMSSYVYQVLAAVEVTEEGRLSVEAELSDPRLTQSVSGVYAHIHGENDHWDSPSTLGVELPELDAIRPGSTLFSRPTDQVAYFTYQYGIAWEVSEQQVIPFTVSVLESPDALEAEVSAFRRGLWRSLGGAGVILLLAQALMFILGLRPLRRVADDVARVESGQSEALGGVYPRELEPLSRNLNRLLKTEKANQKRYRNALDSLAHSLKTPLAVIRSSMERASGEERNTVYKAADEMQHLIATRLERAAASTRSTMVQPVMIKPQIQRLLASLSKVYSHKMIAAEVNISDEVKFYGEERDLLELVGNLMDNAYKYGNQRVRVSADVISAESSRPGMWLLVEDDGPGISQAQWPVLLQRGIRGDERQEGHGLGLAIIQELVTAYDGDITLTESEWGGVGIKVVFGAT